MIFEIINPSDPYTLEANDFEVASVAVVLLGQGAYGMKQLDGDKSLEIPIMMFGGADQWFTDNFGDNAETVIGRVVNEKCLQLADILDSVRIGGLEDREKGEDYRDQRRSSLNDIGRRANLYTKNLREKASDTNAS